MIQILAKPGPQMLTRGDRLILYNSDFGFGAHSLWLTGTTPERAWWDEYVTRHASNDSFALCGLQLGEREQPSASSTRKKECRKVKECAGFRLGPACMQGQRFCGSNLFPHLECCAGKLQNWRASMTIVAVLLSISVGCYMFGALYSPWGKDYRTEKQAATALPADEVSSRNSWRDPLPAAEIIRLTDNPMFMAGPVPCRVAYLQGIEGRMHAYKVFAIISTCCAALLPFTITHARLVTHTSKRMYMR